MEKTGEEPSVYPSIQLDCTYSDFYYYFRDKESFEKYIRTVGGTIRFSDGNLSEMSEKIQHFVS